MITSEFQTALRNLRKQLTDILRLLHEDPVKGELQFKFTRCHKPSCACNNGPPHGPYPTWAHDRKQVGLGGLDEATWQVLLETEYARRLRKEIAFIDLTLTSLAREEIRRTRRAEKAAKSQRKGGATRG